MVILKKVRASTLMETLVASVLIVVVFMISSMILNNLFSNVIKNDTRAIDGYLNELQYLYRHHKLTVPYQDDFNHWHVSIMSHKEKEADRVVFEALNNNNKKITKIIHANQE